MDRHNYASGETTTLARPFFKHVAWLPRVSRRRHRDRLICIHESERTATVLFGTETRKNLRLPAGGRGKSTDVSVCFFFLLSSLFLLPSFLTFIIKFQSTPLFLHAVPDMYGNKNVPIVSHAKCVYGQVQSHFLYVLFWNACLRIASHLPISNFPKSKDQNLTRFKNKYSEKS